MGHLISTRGRRGEQEGGGTGCGCEKEGVQLVTADRSRKDVMWYRVWLGELPAQESPWHVAQSGLIVVGVGSVRSSLVLSPEKYIVSQV